MRPKGTTAELEARRRLAADLLSDGKTLAEIVRILKVSASSVKRWKKAWQTGGVEALAAKPHPGPTPKLSARQRERLTKILVRGPCAAGFRTDLWTCARVAQIVESRFGVKYHVDHLGRVLRSMGFTPQKPARRARERDEAAIQRWREHDWPRIKKRGATAKPA